MMQRNCRSPWQVIVRPGCGEMTAHIPWGGRRPEKPKAGQGVDRERSEAEAVRRASTTIRRLCTEHGLRRMWTLTCSEEWATHDRAVVRGYVRRLAERLSKLNVVAWVAVGELHPGGHGWHVHLVIDRWLPKHVIAAAWGRGFVDARYIRSSDGDRAGSRRAAHYVAKYVSKDAESDDRRMGDHRYWRAQGMAIAEVSCEATNEELAHLLDLVRAGAPVVWSWDSTTDDEWRGPPVRCWRW